MNIIRSGTEEERMKLPQWEGKYYLILDPMNSYIRRLCYQEIPETYGDLLSVMKLNEDNKVSILKLHQ